MPRYVYYFAATLAVLIALLLITERCPGQSIPATDKLHAAFLIEDHTPSETVLDKNYDDQSLLHLMQAESHRFNRYDVLPFQPLLLQYDRELIDNAVFELLLTEDLAYTIDRLRQMDNDRYRLSEFCRLARQNQIDCLIVITLTKGSKTNEYRCDYLDTASTQCVRYDTVTMTRNESQATLCRQLTRTLWKLAPKE